MLVYERRARGRTSEAAAASAAGQMLLRRRQRALRTLPRTRQNQAAHLPAHAQAPACLRPARHTWGRRHLVASLWVPCRSQGSSSLAPPRPWPPVPCRDPAAPQQLLPAALAAHPGPRSSSTGRTASQPGRPIRKDAAPQMRRLSGLTGSCSSDPTERRRTPGSASRLAHISCRRGKGPAVRRGPVSRLRQDPGGHAGAGGDQPLGLLSHPVCAPHKARCSPEKGEQKAAGRLGHCRPAIHPTTCPSPTYRLSFSCSLTRSPTPTHMVTPQSPTLVLLLLTLPPLTHHRHPLTHPPTTTATLSPTHPPPPPSHPPTHHLPSSCSPPGCPPRPQTQS